MKLAELKALAGDASKGPYKACHNGNCKCGMVWSLHADAVVCCAVGAADENITCGEGFTDEQKARNARHIAACSPERISALVQAAEALVSIRVFAQDCIETGYDRGSLGNLYAIRDLCDAALSALREADLQP